jgi:hypothetical protein
MSPMYLVCTQPSRAVPVPVPVLDRSHRGPRLAGDANAKDGDRPKGASKDHAVALPGIAHDQPAMSTTMHRSSLSLGFLGAVVLGASAFVMACSSSKTETPATSTAAAVSGAADTHCAGKPVVVASQAKCHVDAGATGTDSGAGAADGGAPKSDFGDTLFNSEGDDDDCKYHVKWQSTAVAQNSDVTFSVVPTNRKDSSAVTGAKPYAEIFLDETHPAPNTPVQTSETTPGTYTIGPVRFDAAGKWTVRFHFAADCDDGEDSPHGHVAFFVKVP